MGVGLLDGLDRFSLMRTVFSWVLGRGPCGEPVGLPTGFEAVGALTTGDAALKASMFSFQPFGGPGLSVQWG